MQSLRGRPHASSQAVSSCPAGELVQLWGGALHPRNASLLCTAGSNDVQVRAGGWCCCSPQPACQGCLRKQWAA